MMSMEGRDFGDLTAEAARFGAVLVAKGLTPDQVATLMRKVQPVLAEAVQLVEDGVDIDAIGFGIQHPGRS